LTNDQVKLVKEANANDIVAVVGSYLTLRAAGGVHKGLCPFHNDRNPSLQVDSRYQNYHCWSCGKRGDVLQFVMDFEKVNFPEALEILAKRANIELASTKATEQQKTRTQLLDVMKWASRVYHDCLLDNDLAASARAYVEERGLDGPTVRKFGVGFGPLTGDWLVQQAVVSRISLDLLERVGLIARRDNGQGFYDRFRDRVLFPIRDPLGRTIAFGGRILPGSRLTRQPKYYNSAETPLFSKGEQLYGLDQARSPGAMAGFLAVVEGYTDVLMAHQKGVPEVVATMGTALTARHVQHLRRFVSRVILVYDADAGGDKGVDRALELFVSQEVDLAIATLPKDLDPCDVLVQPDGAARFREFLRSAVDALDFKLQRLLDNGQMHGVESRRRAVDSILGIIALAPELPGQAGAVKRELIVTRIARRLTLKEETLWARLEELRRQNRRTEEKQLATREPAPSEEIRSERPLPVEEQVFQILLAEPELVRVAADQLPVENIRHPGLQRFLRLLYDVFAEGELPSVDLLRSRMDNPRQIEWALKQADIGRRNADRTAWLQELIAFFRARREQAEQTETLNQLQGMQDEQKKFDLLKRLQNRNLGTDK